MAVVFPDLNITFIVFVDAPSLDESQTKLLLDGKFDVLVGNPISPHVVPSEFTSSIAYEWRRSSSPASPSEDPLSLLPGADGW